MDFVLLRREITAEPGGPGGITYVTMHDGSVLRFQKPHAGYTPTDRLAAYSHMKECNDRSEVATGRSRLSRAFGSPSSSPPLGYSGKRPNQGLPAQEYRSVLVADHPQRSSPSVHGLRRGAARDDQQPLP